MNLSAEGFAMAAAAFGACSAFFTMIGILVGLRNGRKADVAAVKAASAAVKAAGASASAEETKAAVTGIAFTINGRMEKLIAILEAKGIVDVELARREGIIEGKKQP
jgi:hypothetical protein